MVPVLYGSPIWLMKNNSETLKNLRVNGNKNLKTNAKTKMEIKVAMAVVFMVMFWYVLKKYNITIEGITNRERICTPKESPTTKLIITNHLFPLGSWISLSHFNPSQNNIAIKNEDIA